MLTMLAVVLVAAVVVAVTAAVAFHRRMVHEIDSLLANAQPSQSQAIREQDFEHLPALVQRWLRYSRVIGTQPPTAVRLRQQGEFNLGRGWMPFNAEQYFTIDPPGFVWKAAFRLVPLVSVAGRDAYRAGVGGIDMRVLSLVPVAKKSGGGLNQGDLLRFLGEMQWFPAAANARYITWESVDATSARATMAYGGIAASMTFTFAPDGRLVEERATRFNDARGRDEIWVNQNASDREFDGVRVPASGEARWEYDTGSFPYIRWTISNLERDNPSRYVD